MKDINENENIPASSCLTATRPIPLCRSSSGCLSLPLHSGNSRRASGRPFLCSPTTQHIVRWSLNFINSTMIYVEHSISNDSFIYFKFPFRKLYPFPNKTTSWIFRSGQTFLWFPIKFTSQTASPCVKFFIKIFRFPKLPNLILMNFTEIASSFRIKIIYLFWYLRVPRLSWVLWSWRPVWVCSSRRTQRSQHICPPLCATSWLVRRTNTWHRIECLCSHRFVSAALSMQTTAGSVLPGSCPPSFWKRTK